MQAIQQSGTCIMLLLLELHQMFDNELQLNYSISSHGSNIFFGRKYGAKKQGDILIKYDNHSDGVVRPTSKMKTKVTL